MISNHLMTLHESLCNRVFAISLILTFMAIALHFKQYRRLTFEMFVLIVNGSALVFIMWLTGNMDRQDMFVALTLGGLSCLPVLWHFNPQRQRLKHLRSREDLPMDAIYDRFFSETGLQKSLVLEVWAEVATLLRVPAGKLRPSDRFDKELAPGGVWLDLDKDAIQLNLAARDRLKQFGSKSDFSAAHTLRDYIELLCNAERLSRQLGSG